MPNVHYNRLIRHHCFKFRDSVSHQMCHIVRQTFLKNMNGIRGIISWHDTQWHSVIPHLLKTIFKFFLVVKSPMDTFHPAKLQHWTSCVHWRKHIIVSCGVAWSFDIIGFLDMIKLYRFSRQKMHYEISSFLLNCVLRCNAFPGFDWVFYMCLREFETTKI